MGDTLELLLKEQGVFVHFRHWLAGELYVPEGEPQPVIVYRYDPKLKLLGWVDGAGGMAHVFPIRKIVEREYEREVVFDTGTRQFVLELPWNAEQEGAIARLRRDAKGRYDEFATWLEGIMSTGEMSPEERRPVYPYRVLFDRELSLKSGWHFLGAYAAALTADADPDFWSFWAFPEYALAAQYQLASGKAAKGSYQEAQMRMEYLIENEGSYHSYLEYPEPVMAPIAMAAAQYAARLWRDKNKTPA